MNQFPIAAYEKSQSVIQLCLQILIVLQQTLTGSWLRNMC